MRLVDRAARHHVLNDCIFRSLEAAGISASKEPSGLIRSDRKRPSDGLLSTNDAVAYNDISHMGCYSSSPTDSYIKASSRERT